MVAAKAPQGSTSWPTRWPTDRRAGGVPDPRAIGPTMIQIGNDGGLLPASRRAAQHADQLRSSSAGDAGMNPAGRRSASHRRRCYLAPGERADVIVDFSQVPSGSKLILYNDAPAPAPSGDRRVDYYTGDPDLTAIGGAPSTIAGYGPNTRTILQFQVDGAASRALRPRGSAARPAGRLRRLPGPGARPGTAPTTRAYARHRRPASPLVEKAR